MKITLQKRHQDRRWRPSVLCIKTLYFLVWVWVWVWDWIHWHASPRMRSPSSRHPPFTNYPFSPCSLVCGGQTSPHKPRLVVSHSTCPPLSCSPMRIQIFNRYCSDKQPHQPLPGWAPDSLMVGIRSPDGLVVGLAPDTLEFWV